ncbi:MAG TPA: acyl-CoA thioesterase II, partial [Acidimicrobiales bacterium]|nr:acyl-CoA thioesterase II [Acidimicrobiales bacterium]
MGAALDQLVEVLDLERLEVNLFRGVSPPEHRIRVFGGQVAGQALVAAGRTVDPLRSVHSLHAYFLRGGDPSVPIIYDVDRIRDGKSFTTRRVVAIQHGEAIFNLQASFHVDEPGFDHQAPMPDAPDPESLPTFREQMAPFAEQIGEWVLDDRPIDLRRVGPHRFFQPGPREPHQLVWFRADGRLPDDPLLHDCVVVYTSDMTLLDTALLPHNVEWGQGNMMMASLDHAMWFHRGFRADEWLLYAQTSPSAHDARG